MNTWFPYVRILHIACGMVALFVAPAAMLTVKGGLAHRRWGKIYFWSMAAVAVTALVMSLYRPIYFLALVAVFSFYFAFRGYRSVIRKHEPARAADWIAALIMLTGSLGLVGVGIHPPAHQFLPAPAVSIVFGLIGATVGAVDIWRFLRPAADRNAWMYSHLGGMVGSYIATVGAFSAVNFYFLPTLVRWLWPTVIGVPAISIWIAYYRSKFAGKDSAAIQSAQPV
jgi:uncharacterized membrane protein